MALGQVMCPVIVAENVLVNNGHFQEVVNVKWLRKPTSSNRREANFVNYIPPLMVNNSDI
jgi:S-adenosylhomocysteine hydrolase